MREFRVVLFPCGSARIALVVAVIFFALSGLMADEAELETQEVKPAAVLKFPKGLTGTSTADRLEQQNLPDRFALEVAPYQPAPVQIDLKAGRPVTARSAPPPPEPDAEAQTLAPRIP